MEHGQEGELNPVPDLLSTIVGSTQSDQLFDTDCLDRRY
jgi:hypothetical protein